MTGFIIWVQSRDHKRAVLIQSPDSDGEGGVKFQFSILDFPCHFDVLFFLDNSYAAEYTYYLIKIEVSERQRKMRKFFQIAAWVVVIGGVGGWWFSIEHNAAKNKKAQETKDKYAQEEKQKAIAQLSNKYNAVSDWSELLSKKSSTSPVLTIEVEDALLRKDNRPVLLRVTLDDVERKENKYLAYFAADFTELKFVLDCNDRQIKKITQRQLGFLDEYVVVAKIRKIRKITFESITETDGEESGINITNSLIATGECLDLLFIGERDLYPENKEDE